MILYATPSRSFFASLFSAAWRGLCISQTSGGGQQYDHIDSGVTGLV
jgi:hypothetical protein